jgi:hypothetical protein
MGSTAVECFVLNQAMRTTQFVKIIIIPAAITCSAFLIYLVDNDLGIGWPHNVVRNWQQFGFFNLHGQLVFNVGGFEATTQTELFAWTGLGTMSFHILLALAVLWATWELLGRSNFAFLTAIITVSMPGYLRWQKGLDPCTLPLLLCLPYIIIILSILRRAHLKFHSFAGLVALILCFTSLNWSTAWVCGPCAALLWFLPIVERCRTILFVALSGLSCAVLGIASVIVKADGEGSGSANLLQFLLSYTWGNTGYGLDLTTGKAALRLAFVNGVGLLPLLLIFGYIVVKRFRRGQRVWSFVSPLALAAMNIIIMRNYFGHHPWLAAPLLLIGLIFSLALMRADSVTGTKPETLGTAINWQKPLGVLSIFLCCFAYSLGVLFFLRANDSNLLSLVYLVRHETGRSDLVVLVKDLDPQTASLAPRLPEALDRRVILINELNDLPAMTDDLVILSATPLSGRVRLLAQSDSGKAKSQSWETKVTRWFNNSVARRRPGDRIEVAVMYYLYHVSSAN